MKVARRVAKAKREQEILRRLRANAARIAQGGAPGLVGALDEDDVDFEGSELGDGLTVAHNLEDFNAGETAILTLADSAILGDDGFVNEDGDHLENLNMRDVETAEKFKKRRSGKKGYQAFESTGMLSQYDEEEGPEGMLLMMLCRCSLCYWTCSLPVLTLVPTVSPEHKRFQTRQGRLNLARVPSGEETRGIQEETG